MKVFAERFKWLRIKAGHTHMSIADSIGCSSSQICYYEKNTTNPRITTLKAIAQAFNVSADYLLGLRDILPSGHYAYEDENSTKIVSAFNKLTVGEVVELLKTLPHDTPIHDKHTITYIVRTDGTMEVCFE